MSNQYTKLNAAVDAFAVKMKAKLHKTCREGRKGWDNPTQFVRANIESGIVACSTKIDAGDVAQAVDIANYAMFLDFNFAEEEGNG